MLIDISATFRLVFCIHIHIFCFTLQSRTLQESLANAKVGVGQQCVYEGPLTKKSTANDPQGTQCWKIHSVAYNVVADNTALHSFSCAKFCKNLNLYSSRSSKVIDLGVNRKRICNLVINSNFGRISYSFRDIDAFSFKIACFPLHRCLTPPRGGTSYNITT